MRAPLEHLRSMSLAKRRTIAVGASALFTVFIFGVWLIAFTREKPAPLSQKIESGVIVEDQTASPFRSFGHAVRSLFDGSTQEYER